MRVYIAGPMTGYRDWNLKAFFLAEECLRSHGFDVANPARNAGGSTWQEAVQFHRDNPHSWAWYLKKDIHTLVECDEVWTLPGWEESRGVELELYVARAVEMNVRHNLLGLRGEKLTEV